MSSPFAERGAPRSYHGWYTDDLIRASDLKLPEGLLNHSMLLPGTIAIMAGPAGHGKTYIAIKLAEAISLGIAFGGLPTLRGSVLFLSEEMQDREMRARLMSYNYVSGNQNLRWMFDQQLRIDQWRGISELYELVLAEGSPDLVIIDALRDVHAGPEGINDYMSPILKGVRNKVARPLDTCILFIHHFGKPTDTNKGINSVRGASVIKDVASDVLTVERAKDVRILDFPKVRHGKSPDSMPFLIQEDPMTLRTDIRFLDGFL